MIIEDEEVYVLRKIEVCKNINWSFMVTLITISVFLSIFSFESHLLSHIIRQGEGGVLVRAL